MVVFPGIAFSDTVFHQTGQGRKNADRRVDRLSVKIPVKYDLSFGDITGQVRDRMGNVIIWHGQDRELCDRTIYSFYDSCTLI